MIYRCRIKANEKKHPPNPASNSFKLTHYLCFQFLPRRADLCDNSRSRSHRGVFMNSIRVFLALVMAALSLAPATAQSKPQYEIYAIRYATLPEFPVAELVAGADPGRKLDIAMMVWLVRGNGHNILVD